MPPERRWIGKALWLVLPVAVPVAAIVLAGLVARTLGCRLDEAGRHACFFLGLDLGGLLYTMGMMGWLLLVTIPAAIIGILLWLAGLPVLLWRRWRGRR